MLQMRRILLSLMLCSICQAPETPPKSEEDFDIIECDEESSTENGSWRVTNWFNKSRDFLFGKQHSICCCPKQNKDMIDIAVRDVPSSDHEKKSVCKKVRKGAEKTGTCVYVSGCTCCLVIKHFGKSMAELILGCFGYAFVGCKQAWHRRRGDS